MFKRFDLTQNNTTVRQEVLAGLVTFFSISYVLFVNPMILGQAGVPSEYSVFSTIFISAIGSFLMGWFANVPLAMAPGMGENAFFTFTLVAAIGLTWQSSLGVVVVSGAIFTLLALSGVMSKLSQSIPTMLKQAITVGIGLFLMLIGFENMGVLTEGALQWNTVGILGLIFVILIKRFEVKGGFLYTILFTTLLYWVIYFDSFEPVSFDLGSLFSFGELVTAIDFSQLLTVEFLLGVFSLTMLLMFETIGMIEALLSDKERSLKAYKMGAIAGFLSGLLGTSPAIPVAENGAGIAEGGRTGLTAMTTGVMFLLALVLTPFLSYIPSEAVGPVIVATGASMALTVRSIQVEKNLEWLPLAAIIALIPLTGSIVDGMAYGFIAYPFVQIIIGKKVKLSLVQWTVSGLFLLTLLATYFLI
ncbi:putative MFS transporter, AGZA family, xanthine/uracil permease [Alkalibacterium putridalgicola]|uniref:Permease n=1 Tax=Alkalibacterium putridalgicola TaxID=426703 RepID=A0A1H7RXL5_9LACT|nr:NCS2 family permease [Alkalibacterium putridalgicola]GEK88324.1 permease [Alkalibacterium putridalgicola]SEL65040.1 putative MFS transporter, AGZA family, xanthine/uracil permease [Alkalibacterium putridalgicola]